MHAQPKNNASRMNAIATASVLLLVVGGASAMAEPSDGNRQGMQGHGMPSQSMPGHGMQDQGMHGISGANGEPGKKSAVSRTIKVELNDNFYKPEKISVKKGETIRFKLTNKGRLVHEFNIGTRGMHMAHQKEMMMMVEHGVLEADKINHDKMMMKMPNGQTMEHNDPNSVLLEPGKSGEVIWKFSKQGDLEFGCNVPGHYDAGMVGKFSIK
jgi:uncharacterized cupredoxin-like copper-binding protein